MNALLKKELRLVLPISLGVLGLVCVAYQLGFGGFKGSNLVALLLMGIVGVSSLGYGKELEHQTLDLQLTIPVSRRRIWATKLIAQVVAVLPLLALLNVSMRSEGPSVPTSEKEFDPIVLWPAFACSSVSLFTWKLRSMIAGAAVGALTSLVWFGIAEPALWTRLAHQIPGTIAHQSGETIRGLISSALVIFLCAFHYRSWMHGEIRGRMTAESGIHNWSLAREGGGSHRRRPLLNLIFKELRLQKPAIFVAMACIAFSLVTYACRGLFPEGGTETY